MGFTSTTVKYILFFFNFFIAVCGAIIFGVAIYIWRGDQAAFTDITKVNLSTPCIALAIAGAFVFLVAFLGCCGAIQESHCMMILYSVIMLVIIIIEAIVIGLVYYKKANINEDDLEKAITDTFLDYNTTKQSIDAVQQAFSCCGTDGSSFYTRHSMTIPDSCYKDNNRNTTLFTRGCLTTLIDFINYNLQTLSYVAIGVGIVEIIAALFGLYYANHIQNSIRGYA